MKTKCSICILALGEKNRMRIYQLIGSAGELTISELQQNLNINQPTVSHHLSILLQQGLVLFKKKGKFKFYSLADSCPHYRHMCILKK